MDRLPAILDVRDDLYAARERADRDIDAGVDDALDRLETYTERDEADREGVLDDVDNELLRLETRVSNEEASRRLQAARNRIHVFRASLDGDSDGLTVIDTTLSRVDDGSPGELDDLRTEDVEVSVTVVNEGPPRDATVVVTFYDAGSGEVRSKRTETFALDGDSQKTIRVSTAVPEDANYYVAVARAAE